MTDFYYVDGNHIRRLRPDIDVRPPREPEQSFGYIDIAVQELSSEEWDGFFDTLDRKGLTVVGQTRTISEGVVRLWLAGTDVGTEYDAVKITSYPDVLYAVTPKEEQDTLKTRSLKAREAFRRYMEK